MTETLDQVQRQRSRLLWVFGMAMAAMCTAVVILSRSGDQSGLDFEQVWPILVGLCGLVVLCVMYLQHHHRQLSAIEARLRDAAVREAMLQAHFSELSFLFDTSTQLQLGLDLQGKLDLAAQRLLPCFDAHQSSIMLFNEATGLLEVRAASGVDAARVTNATMKPGEGAAGQAFSGGEVLNLTAESAKLRFADQPDYGRQIAAGLCVPMRFKGTPIGVVSVTRATGDPFSEMHATMLTAFAEHCAATVVKTDQELLDRVRKTA